MTGLVALVYSIIEAPGQGWASARTLAGLGAGLVRSSPDRAERGAAACGNAW
jgi:hypothetical protein